jgi:hypothetical protein
MKSHFIPNFGKVGTGITVVFGKGKGTSQKSYQKAFSSQKQASLPQIFALVLHSQKLCFWGKIFQLWDNGGFLEREWMKLFSGNFLHYKFQIPLLFKGHFVKSLVVFFKTFLVLNFVQPKN